MAAGLSLAGLALTVTGASVDDPQACVGLIVAGATVSDAGRYLAHGGAVLPAVHIDYSGCGALPAAVEVPDVGAALSPAKVQSVRVDEDTHTATVIVPDDQLSLAIGKRGQNVRLAAKLSGLRIDVMSASEAGVGAAALETESEESEAVVAEETPVEAAPEAPAAETDAEEKSE